MKKNNIFGIIMGLSILTIFISACSNDSIDTKKLNSEKSDSDELELRARGSNSDTVKLDAFSTYLQTQNLLSRINSIDRNKSFIEIIDGIEVLFLVVRNNKDGGIIKGTKTSPNGKMMVPLNREYLIVYEEYSNLDEARNSLIIRSYDWNYDKKFYELEVINSIKVQEGFFPVIGNNPTNSNTNSSLPSSCTGGIDGNVSWGECMNCVTTVCSSDPNCKSTCDLLDKLSVVYHMVGGFGALSGCNVTLGIGCIGVAAVY